MQSTGVQEYRVGWAGALRDGHEGLMRKKQVFSHWWTDSPKTSPEQENGGPGSGRPTRRAEVPRPRRIQSLSVQPIGKQNLLSTRKAGPPTSNEKAGPR